MRGLLLGAMAFAAMATPAAAQTTPAAPAPALTKLIATSDQLKVKLQTAARGRAPSLKNADAALVRGTFDAPAIRLMPLTLDIGDVCVAVGTSIVAYTEYATRVTASDPNPVAAGDALLMTLQDEMAIGAEAANVCVQRGFRAVGITVAGMAADQRGGALAPLKQMRDGAVQTIEGTLSSLVQPKVKPANRKRMLASINEDAAELAASFPAGERQAVKTRVQGFEAKMPAALRASLSKVIAAFSGTRCNVLCQTAGQ